MKLPTWVLLDWPRKLAALVFAMLIWYSVSIQLREATTITVPVTLSLPPGMMVLNQLQPRVSLHLRGSRRSLDNLTPKDFKVEPVIPAKTAAGPYQVRLKMSDVLLTGSTAQLMSIEPDNFTVTLDTIVTKTDCPVRPIFAGAPPEGWRRKNLLITPPRVTLTGPSSVVNDIQEVTTHSIMLNDSMDEVMDYSVPLSPYPQVTMNYERVTVKVEFARAEDDAFLPNLPVAVLAPRDSDLYVSAFLDPPQPQVDATIRGPKSILDSVSPSKLSADMRAFIDLSECTKLGPQVLRVQLWGKDNFQVHNISPATLKVIVARRSPALLPGVLPAPLAPAPSVPASGTPAGK